MSQYPDGAPYGNTTTSLTGIQMPLGIVGPDGLEVMSEAISLFCISLLAIVFGAKSYNETWKTTNYGRIIVLLLYICSWSFSVTSVLVVSTNDFNIISCTIGMLSCDVFYAGTKIILYMWLIERVHIVTNTKKKRTKSCAYKFHIALLFPYVVIFILMLTFRNIYIEDNGICMMGLQYVASIPLLIYDFIFNFYLTWLFMRPLMSVGRNSRMDWKRSRLYRLARRTLVASLVCLLVSFANVSVVVITQGHERGLECLTMCTVDVTINVLTVHWVTSNNQKGGKDVTTRNKHAHTGDVMTAEMTFDEQETFSDKPARGKFDAPTDQDDSSSHESQPSGYQSNTSTQPLQY
ncbi:hypothetical protein DM01DRAFT_1399346 [Hesseltinella vesiculosa]|uniref:G-protein coupled receptors family 1 profile domain-containing protein n=1 Tax=Hesseltinella vesiculosa TaxID=101127 RepID=A0A1X2G412_9FUNG|nr:hypothetical protein DM01DRAFT_1399346 [Hesseltinella vesiculosa]